MKPVFTSLCLFLSLLTINIYGQALPDSTLKKIDKIFEPWNNTHSPGCTVGIIRNDSLIFSKGYGMANLEYDIPNTPATIYHMASISKQFTAFSIVLLARQGRLRLEDDIRTYLPWFPDLKEKITILQLLNHTSGIRDQWQLLAIAGTQLNDVITQEQIVKVLSRQQGLNSKPGQRYNYCNSGFTMLAEIVKSVTKQTLRQFTDSAIFKPLGMHNTHFHDDAGEIVKNRSYSYNSEDSGHFTNSILSYSNMGATSLFTNINDMAKWTMNFYAHKVGDQQDIDMLTKKAHLSNGREIDYALGISVSNYKGNKCFSHSGADAGYRTMLIVFPGLKLSFLVFGNEGDFNTYKKAYELVDLFIGGTDIKGPVKPDTSQGLLKDTALLRGYPGDYISEEGDKAQFRLTNGKPYVEGNGPGVLLKEYKGSFSPMNNPFIKYTFDTPHPGDTLVTVSTYGDKQIFSKYSPKTYTDETLTTYTGIYYCPELECRYGIILKDHHLVMTNIKYEDMPLEPAGPDHLFNDFWAMHHLRMLRDGKGRITGFEVNNGRVLHLQFNKL